MKETIAILLGYLTCDDPTMQTKYENLLSSFWHKDSGSLISSYSVNGAGDVTFNLIDGDDQANQIVIPQFVLPGSMPMGFIDGLVDTLNDKVDTITGKQLSTEDFTTELLNKLNALEPYIHPALHEITAINGLQGILDSLQGQVDDKLPLGGYNGTAQNLSDSIDGVFNHNNDVNPGDLGYLAVSDLSTVATNVIAIQSGERKTLDEFFQVETPVTILAAARDRIVAFDRDIHFRNHIFDYQSSEFFDTEADLSDITPTEFATGYVEEFEPTLAREAYVFFDYGGSDAWELTYTSVPLASYDNWLTTIFPTLLSNYTFPRGLIIGVYDVSGYSYAFLNAAKTAMSALVPEDDILNDTSILRKYYVNDDIIGYADALAASDTIPEIADYLITDVLTVNKKFISESDINDVYAEYGDSGYTKYYVKQRINAVDAEFNKGWLKAYSPLSASGLDDHEFKHGKAKLPTGFGDIFTNIILNAIDKDAEADTLENNVVMVRDKDGYISPVFDVSYYDIEYEIERIAIENGLQLRNRTSGLTQTGINILVSDIDNTHSDAMAAWVLYYHPDFAGQVFETDDEPAGDFLVTSDFGASYAKERGCNIIVEARTGSHLKANLADPDLLFVAAHGSNGDQRLDQTSGPEEFDNNIVLVGSGLPSDADIDWTTSFGYGVRYIEPTRIADVPPGADTTYLHATEHQQSPAAAFVTSKLKAISDATRMNWATVLKAADATASQGGVWDMYRGYGIIDVTAAIAWINTNFGDFNQYLADRYAGMFGQSDRLTYGDIHQNTPLPKRLVVSEGSGSANPTTSDIPEGKSMIWKNTTNAEVRTWRNDGGTMVASAAFTTIP